ncbi:hypothetical protein [Lacibacter sp. H407]|uniref:hypothetical protein n=1 Tax=Lacibacter sp. H407 TaxID=3133423 RepID=UPI0030BCF468
MINAEVFHRLLQQPFLLNECSEADLEMLAYQYPWFGTAQLLLAAKQKQSGRINAEKQLQKAALYFNEPLLLQQQWKKFAITELVSAEKPVADEELTIPEIISIDENDAALDAEALLVVEEMKDEQQAVITDAVMDAEAMLEVEAMKEEKDAVITDAVLDAEAMLHAEAAKDEAIITKEADIESAAAASIEAEAAREEISQIKIQPEQEEEKPVFTFEPFHTVDYFASQGIKLREEKLADDQLGKQVKSFTQWLRSMKKIYVEEQKELDSSMEKEVVSIATESNQQTEVITETMAEVLVKQGKRTQAIDLYRKLSLLHPEKSVYFASRIDELKQ